MIACSSDAACPTGARCLAASLPLPGRNGSGAFGSAASGTPLYSEGPIAVSGTSPQVKSTNNTTVKVSASATVSWQVVYASTAANVTGSTSSCETTTLTIDNHHS